MHLRQSMFNILTHQKGALIFSTIIHKNLSRVILAHNYASKAEKKQGMDRKPTPKVEHTMKSIAAKGFLRLTQEYTPTKNYREDLTTICTRHLNNHDEETLLNGKKATILIEAAAKLNFCIPNSLLHQITTVGDLISFYGQETSSKTPLQKLKTMDLPENLHIQYEYYRWHPDTDAVFGGVTAFPESSTLVTGLKYRGKYKGHKQNIKFPRA